MECTGPDAPEAVFTAHRSRLVGVAYRLLGSVGDAEDVVQEAWLRWGRVDTATVADPEAFLVRTVSRLALDRLRRIAARRETYVGPWLPEPVLTGGRDDPAAEAERAASVSLAMLVVLETLSPLERTVFVLHEAFAYPTAEIAEIVERSPAAVRQLAHRAREHVAARRPRFPADPAVRRAATERFLRASLEGDLGRAAGAARPRRHAVGRRRREGEGTAAPDPRRRQDRPLLRGDRHGAAAARGDRGGRRGQRRAGGGAGGSGGGDRGAAARPRRRRPGRRSPAGRQPGQADRTRGAARARLSLDGAGPAAEGCAIAPPPGGFRTEGRDHDRAPHRRRRRSRPRRREGRGGVARRGVRRPDRAVRRRAAPPLRAAAAVEGLPAGQRRARHGLRAPRDVVRRARRRPAAGRRR